MLATVVSNHEVMPKAYLIWLEAPQIASEARPGQFVMVNCGNTLVLPRPLSIHQRDDNKIALLFNIVGKGTRWLSQRCIGNTIDIFGPLGNGSSVLPETKNLLLVAGGIGIAPLYFLAQEALNEGRAVTLIFGTQSGSQLYPERHLPVGIKLAQATEDGTVGHHGLVTDLLPDYIDWADHVFACGPMPMYRDIYIQREKLLKGKPLQVSLEVRMGCGLGVCYGCTVKTKSGLKQVCQDGPVFDLEDILFEKDNEK